MYTDGTKKTGLTGNCFTSVNAYHHENHSQKHSQKESHKTIAKFSVMLYSLANVILISKLLIVEAKLVNKIGRHLLHLIIRKGLATPGPTTVI